jgi:hypothetical protein
MAEADGGRGGRGAPGGDLGIRGPWVYTEATPDRVYIVDSGVLLPGAESGGILIEWQRPGLVIDCCGITVADGSPVGMASIGLKATIGDYDTEVFTSGSSSAYAIMGGLFGLAAERRYQLYRRVRAATKWTMYFKNFHATNTYQAKVHLSFYVKG